MGRALRAANVSSAILAALERADVPADLTVELGAAAARLARLRELDDDQAEQLLAAAEALLARLRGRVA